MPFGTGPQAYLVLLYSKVCRHQRPVCPQYTFVMPAAYQNSVGLGLFYLNRFDRLVRGSAYETEVA